MSKADILLQRRAFCKRMIDSGKCLYYRKGSACDCEALAAIAFPFPKVTRYRRVTTSVGSAYEAREDGLYFSYLCDNIFTKSSYHLSDIATLASLLDADTLRRIADSGKCGPTEEVEVE